MRQWNHAKELTRRQIEKSIRNYQSLLFYILARVWHMFFNGLPAASKILEYARMDVKSVNLNEQAFEGTVVGVVRH
jgi:hypothetical protein